MNYEKELKDLLNRVEQDVNEYGYFDDSDGADGLPTIIIELVYKNGNDENFDDKKAAELELELGNILPELLHEKYEVYTEQYENGDITVIYYKTESGLKEYHELCESIRRT